MRFSKPEVEEGIAPTKTSGNDGSPSSASTPPGRRTLTLPYRNTNKMWYLWGDNNKHDTMRRERESGTTHIDGGSYPDPMHSFSSSYPASGDKGFAIALDKYVALSSTTDGN